MVSLCDKYNNNSKNDAVNFLIFEQMVVAIVVCNKGDDNINDRYNDDGGDGSDVDGSKKINYLFLNIKIRISYSINNKNKKIVDIWF